MDADQNMSHVTKHSFVEENYVPYVPMCCKKKCLLRCFKMRTVAFLFEHTTTA